MCVCMYTQIQVHCANTVTVRGHTVGRVHFGRMRKVHYGSSRDVPDIIVVYEHRVIGSALIGHIACILSFNLFLHKATLMSSINYTPCSLHTCTSRKHVHKYTHTYIFLTDVFYIFIALLANNISR